MSWQIGHSFCSRLLVIFSCCRPRHPAGSVGNFKEFRTLRSHCSSIDPALWWPNLPHSPGHERAGRGTFRQNLKKKNRIPLDQLRQFHWSNQKVAPFNFEPINGQRPAESRSSCLTIIKRSDGWDVIPAGGVATASKKGKCAEGRLIWKIIGSQQKGQERERGKREKIQIIAIYSNKGHGTGVCRFLAAGRQQQRRRQPIDRPRRSKGGAKAFPSQQGRTKRWGDQCAS